MSPSTARAGEPSSGFKYLIVAIICLSAPPLLAMPELKVAGWLGLGALIALLIPRCKRRFNAHMLLLVAALGLLGIVPITTDISYGHMISMGAILAATVALTYLVTTRFMKERSIVFPLGFGRRWRRREIAYVLFAGLAAYLILPLYLAGTGSYLNWDVELNPSHLVRLFIGTNALGIWDEVFFVGVCLALLRQHIPFVWANIAQATLWTTFLYELGFRGWGPYAIFLFALSQGYVFMKSKSLLYVITVHLTIDLMLFLVLVHLHHPDYLRIFVTSPY